MYLQNDVQKSASLLCVHCLYKVEIAMAPGLNLVEPHGFVIKSFSELHSLIFVYWHLSWRKDLNQLFVIPLTP